MADPTREEFDAKLATVAARAETRFVELSGKMDRVIESMSSLKSTVTGELDHIKTEIRTVKSDNNFTRWTILGVIIAGVAALWLTQANLLSAFTTGLTLREHPASSQPQAPLGLQPPNRQ